MLSPNGGGLADPPPAVRSAHHVEDDAAIHTVPITSVGPPECGRFVFSLHGDEPLVAAKTPAPGVPLHAGADVPREEGVGLGDAEDRRIEQRLAAAVERGLDLVEVAPTARPPVVKIMDYGKFKFEEAKAARAAKKKQHIIQLKEVKYRPGIDDHDFDFKTRHAREFLGDGNKVKVTMMFRGRQIAHLELGKAVLDRVSASLADIGKIEADAKLEGRNMTMVRAPK